MTDPQLFPRDLSWLSFNDRVLQEAEDPENPLIERLRFLAIFSSNLDEFYRVRVAHHNGLKRLKKKTQAKYRLSPAEALKSIYRTVDAQQERFGKVYREEIIPGLRKHGIHLMDGQDFTQEDLDHLRTQFDSDIKPHLRTYKVDPENPPFLQDREIYLCLRRASGMLVLLHLPYAECGRFVVLPGKDHRVVQLDDVLRLFLSDLFSDAQDCEAYAVKISRDAELYLEDEFEGSVAEKIRRSLAKRAVGKPSRLLFDTAMPQDMKQELRQALRLKKSDMMPGGRYHNFSHFFGLPFGDRPELIFPAQAALDHTTLSSAQSIFDVVAKEDVLMHFPYQSFSPVLDWLREAATDGSVTEIGITLYRVAEDSALGHALLDALKRGIRVTAFVEVQARFDEASNLAWGKRLEEAGADVIYSYEGLKVHTKLFYIVRVEGEGERTYAYLGTGNFNEKTARIYCDHALFTAHPEMCADVRQVFDYLKDRSLSPKMEHVLMAPDFLRTGLEALIDREIAHARAGRIGFLQLKMNSLEDPEMIAKLYEASNAGVRIELIVRGICCLIPGIEGQSENIEIRSIVGRYLEHARLYWFENDGEPELYVASADWMTRNLSRRVEVAFPILKPELKGELKRLLDLQWADNVKARMIDAGQTNPFHRNRLRKTECQTAFYRYLSEKATSQ